MHVPELLLLVLCALCSSSIVGTTLESGLWKSLEIPGSSPRGCRYSMRLNRLHRVYPSPNLHPFRVVQNS